MDDQQLLDHTIDDLAHKIRDGTTEYELVRAAGLLRQLLTDAHPVAPTVAKAHGQKLQFEINDPPLPWEEVPGLRPFEIWALADAFYPPDGAAPTRRTVDLPGLLAARLMVIRGETVTVKDLIRHIAHVEGGIHAGTPHEQIEHTLAATSPALEIAGYPASVAALRAVTRVVLDGLAPLRTPPDP